MRSEMFRCLGVAVVTVAFWRIPGLKDWVCVDEERRSNSKVGLRQAGVARKQGTIIGSVGFTWLFDCSVRQSVIEYILLPIWKEI